MREEREVWFEEFRQSCQVSRRGNREVGDEGDDVGGAGPVDVEEEGRVVVRGWQGGERCASNIPFTGIGRRSVGRRKKLSHKCVFFGRGGVGPPGLGKGDIYLFKAAI